MTVRMNDKIIEIFTGATVKDVLLKYSKKKYQSALKGKMIVVDENNNPVELNGEVSEGQRLYIVDTEKK